MIIQVVVGLIKGGRKWLDPEDVSFRWHGTSGILLLLLACVTIALGVWLPISKGEEALWTWRLSFKLVITGMVGGLLGHAVLDHFFFDDSEDHHTSPRSPESPKGKDIWPKQVI